LVLLLFLLFLVSCFRWLSGVLLFCFVVLFSAGATLARRKHLNQYAEISMHFGILTGMGFSCYMALKLEGLHTFAHCQQTLNA